MNNSDHKSENEFIEFFKKYWAFLPAIIGAISTVVEFIKLWQGDQATVTYVTVILGILILLAVLGWFSFRRKESSFYDARGKLKNVYSPYYPKAYKWSRLGLVIFILTGTVLGFLLYRQQQVLETKIIILVMNINGPLPENYRITEEIITQLKKELSVYEDTLVLSLPEIIIEQQGSDYARIVGKQYNADIVLWGWYGVTNSNVLITLNVENLNKQQFPELGIRETIQTQTEVADLESFTLQQNLSEQMSASIVFLRGLARFQIGDYKNALDSFNKALNSPEWNTELVNKATVYFYRGFLYLKQEQYDEAISDYTKGIELDSSKSGAFISRGTAYYYKGDYEQAFSDFTLAIEKNPKLSDAYFNRGNVYYQKGEYGNAIIEYSQAIQLDPLKDEAYNNRGFIYADRGDYEKAISDFTQIIQLDSKNSTAYNNRGTVFADIGKQDKAIEDYIRAIKIDPKNELAYSNRCFAFYNLKQYEKAIMDCTQAIKLNPQFEAAYNNRGLAYDSEGEYYKAVEDYNQAIQIDHQFDKAYFNRGRTYFKIGDFDNAITDFTQALQINPLNFDAYFNRGLSYGKKGEHKNAIEDYNQYIKHYPNDMWGYINRAVSYKKSGMNANAIQDLHQARTLTQEIEDQKTIDEILNSIP